MVASSSKWDLSNFKAATLKDTPNLFQAFGIKATPFIPTLSPALGTQAAGNSIPMSQFAPQAGTTPQGGGTTNPTAPVNTQGLANPIGKGLAGGRIDMGVDYTGKGPLYALGDGTITQNDTASPWPGKTFIQLKLTSGPYKGRTIYYAENIQSQVRQGQTVKAGQLIGYARGTYPYTEIGWGTGSGETTSAAASGQAAAGQRAGDPGRYSTGYGMSMNALLHKLGAPAGQVDQPVQGSAG